MPIPDQIDSEKLAEVALAVLSLTMFSDHGATRAWKGLDWDLLALLHQKGWILDPKDKAKSVVFTEEGQRLAFAAFEKHFMQERR